MLSTLARRLDLQADEMRLAVTLGGILFAITSSYTLVKTARDVLFLAQLPATTLPYVYLGVGLVTLVVSVLVGRLTHRVRTAETLAGTALVSAVVLAGFAWLARQDREWIAVAFYVWVNLYGLILVSQFWAFTNSVSHPGEAKRIFGIIGGGGILGGLVGGIVAGRVGSGVGVHWLVVVGAVLVGLTVPGVYTGLRRGTVPEPEAVPEDGGGETRPWKVRYVRWLGLAALCSVLVTGLLDYQLKVELQTRYPSRAQLASFFGLFYTVMNLAALTFQMFGTRVLLQRLGAGWSAAVLPMGLGAGAAVTMIVPGFTSVLGTRLWDQVTRLSLNKSATELFYFPLEPGLRRRAKALIEAGLERTGDALAGLLILGLTVSLGASTWTIASLVVVLVLVWIAAWFGVRRGYVKELGRNLRRMNLDPTQARISLREASLRGEMLRLLQSPYERVVLHGIAMLEENDPRALRRQLPPLLNHASSAVRARALALAAVMDPESTRTRIRELIEDPDPLVRVEALRAQAALGEGHPTEALEQLAGEPDPKLRTAALQSLFELAPATEEERRRHDEANLRREIRLAQPDALQRIRG